jgi:tetratricopeptide (TPR) repeat protein
MIQAREELAYLYGRLGRSDEWIAQLDALRALDPNAERDVALGLAYSKAGQSDRAVITLRLAAERHPEHRHTFVAVGRVWLETAQARNDRIELNKALEALEKAVATDGTSEAFTLYGRALLLASDNELAERMLLQATQKLPAESLAFYYLGDAAARRGHYDVARQALLDYLGLEGEDPDARRRSQLATRIADLSMRVGDYPLAASYFERAAPTFGGDPDFVIKFAEARWRAGQSEAAKTMLDRVLEKDPTNSAARTLARRIR